ncbi:hypothetical protein KEJ36_04040 [Candidatus Bathyarchaeota archaeon]|nr:hypothetical protein [Candidatus Bathyarchaeota archaeon]MBS7627967.1 hypothetical protein [Candidatus Bathyarchaeota archaeon]
MEGSHEVNPIPYDRRNAFCAHCGAFMPYEGALVIQAEAALMPEVLPFLAPLPPELAEATEGSHAEGMVGRGKAERRGGGRGKGKC